MNIERILVPIEKSKTAESLKDPELLKLFGEPLDLESNPAELNKTIGSATKTYPVENSGMFLGHTYVCSVTLKPYTTHVSGNGYIFCEQCNSAIGTIRKI